MAIENTPMFKIPQGDERERWVKIGRVTTNITNLINGFSVLITGTSNFDNNVPGTDIIQLSTRGGLNFQVYTLIPGGNPVTNYGYRLNGTNTEIWINDTLWSYEKTCIVLMAKDSVLGSNMQVGTLETVYTNAPAGFIPISNISRFVLFGSHWQGKETLIPPGKIDVRVHDCFRISPGISTGVDSRAVNDQFDIVGTNEASVRGKTIRILNDAKYGNAPATLRVTAGNGSFTYVLPQNRFVDCFIDSLNKFYFMS